MPQNDFISGFFLEDNGWVKSKEKGIYERDGHKIFYDGTNWHYDGKRIEDSIKENPFISTNTKNPVSQGL